MKTRKGNMEKRVRKTEEREGKYGKINVFENRKVENVELKITRKKSYNSFSCTYVVSAV